MLAGWSRESANLHREAKEEMWFIRSGTKESPLARIPTEVFEAIFVPGLQVCAPLGDDFDVVGVVEPDPALRARAEKSGVYKDLKWMTQEQLLNTPGL